MNSFGSSLALLLKMRKMLLKKKTDSFSRSVPCPSPPSFNCQHFWAINAGVGWWSLGSLFFSRWYQFTITRYERLCFQGRQCPLSFSSRAARHASRVRLRLIPAQPTVSCQLLCILLLMFKETASNIWERASQAFRVQNMPASFLLIRLMSTSYSSKSMRKTICFSSGVWPVALEACIYYSLQGKRQMQCWRTYGGLIHHHTLLLKCSASSLFYCYWFLSSAGTKARETWRVCMLWESLNISPDHEWIE